MRTISPRALLVLSSILVASGCYRSHPIGDAEVPDARRPDARVPDADLRDARVPDADLRDARVPDADLRDARVPDADLRDARVPDADLRDARVPDAGFTPCTSDFDCRGVCVRTPGVAPEDLAPLALSCGPTSAARSDGDLCSAPADCGRGLCVVAGSCVAPCAANSDCESGQRCAELWVRTSGSSMQWLYGCVDRVNMPADVRVRRVRAGVALASDTPDTFELSSAPGTQLLVVQPRVPQTLYASQFRTAGPAPVMLFDVEGYAGDGPPPLAPFGSFGPLLSILMPNGPRAPTSPAGYSLDLYSESRTPLFVTSLSREGVGTTLDLELFYVGATGLAPMGDRGPPRVAAALATVERVFARLGVRLGEVRQHLVVGQLRRDFAIIEAAPDGDLPEMPALLHLSAGAARSSVSIFLVREVDMALGVAGGIPGPEAMHGTSSSGILIAVDLHDPVLDDLGLSIAHEIGHFLGLWHTTELDGTIWEPLPDTPRCPLSRDADGDGYLTADECAGRGGFNLMFWAGVGEGLSPQQATVLSHAPLLR
ncbi:MAG: hypothetical protein GXP55_05040 [Deltaproteobacteria bacterium]|nr:hypothetical protein [Deltaproteobacteria bacterium]